MMNLPPPPHLEALDEPAKPPRVVRVPPRPSRARRFLRALRWVALALVLLTAGVFLFLATPPGRSAATAIAQGVMNSRIRGTSHIGSITRLDFDGVEMHDIAVDTPTGERVIAADRMTAEFAFIESVRRGALVMTPVTLEGGTMRVTHGPHDQIALVDALTVPPDRFMVEVQLRDIRMLHQRVVFQLPPIPFAVELDNVHGLTDMSMSHEFHARMDRVSGFVNFPVLHIGFRDLSGRIESGDRRPLRIAMVLELEVADPAMRIVYTAPGAIGRDGGAAMGIELGEGTPDPTGTATHRPARDQ
jgi:hypothetical protein